MKADEKMKIFVVGGTGRVGQKMLEILSNSEYDVTAGARNPQDLVKFDKIQVVNFDLTGTIDEMKKAITGFDVIIDVAGSAGNGLLQVDLFGATNLMQAAEKAGVKRFVLLSTIFALQPEKWTTPGFIALRDYYIAKHFADLYLTKNVNLDYTILQPGYLTENSGTGKIAVNDDISAPATIEDVAETLVELVKSDNTIGKVITMHNGETEISEVIKAI